MNKRNDFNDVFLNRRSIRKYDSTIKISSKELEEMINKALRAPSANNLQPWHIAVISSKEAKEKYSNLFTFNRLQYETSSAIVILFANLDYASNANEIFDLALSKGYMDQETKERQLERFSNKDSVPKETILKTALLDSGMLAMSMMLVFRSHGYDTCPIGGFNKDLAVYMFNLENATATVAISVGVALDEGYQSVRLPFEKIGTIE